MKRTNTAYQPLKRDLADYQRQYLEIPYESHQVLFRKRKIKEILKKYPHQKLLEIGCGLDAIFLDVDSYSHLTVLEPCSIFYEKAIADADRAENNNIEIVNSTLEESLDQLSNKNFDFILVSSLLHEISHPEKFLKSLHQISARNTVIHINVPNGKSFHRLLGVEMGLINSEFQKSEYNIKFQQNTVFGLESLIEMTRSSGFKIIDSGSYAFKPFTHLQMQAMIDSGIMTKQMLEGFYNMEKHMPGMGSEIFVNINKA